MLGRKHLIAEEFALWRESSFSGSRFFSFQASRRKFHSSSSSRSRLSSFAVIGFRPSRAFLHHRSDARSYQRSAAGRKPLPFGGGYRRSCQSVVAGRGRWSCDAVAMVKGRGGWDVVRLLGLAPVTRGSSVVGKWASDCLIIPVFSPLHPVGGGGFTTEVDLR